MTSDIAVIGAGITGLSVAFHLSELGTDRVVVLERSGVGSGASGVQPGGVRQQWGTRLNCLMARESLKFYRSLGDRLALRVDPVFRECGYLFVAHEAETAQRLQDDVRLQKEIGVPSRFVTPDEAAALVPGLVAGTILGGGYCAEDGYFDRPQAVIEAFAEAATRNGVGIEHGEVTEIAPAGAGYRLELRDGRSLSTGAVVVAAYLDSVSLIGPLGIDVPIERQDKWVFLSEPIRERLLEPLVVAPDRGFAAKQLNEGRLLASDLHAEGDPEHLREHWRAKVRRVVLELLPHLEFVPLPLLVGGPYDVTPDHQAIVGPVPGHDRLFIAAGFSGHGFMMAPTIGEGVARMVVDEDPGPLIRELSLERFARNELIPERQVV